jgi:hypothetical protein
MPVLRMLGYAAAVALVVYVGFRAAEDFHPSELTWWPLPIAVLCATIWWLMLARGWSLFVGGRTTRSDVSVWCRTQALRFLPGGFWAPASRVTVVHGGWKDKLAPVVGENLTALCAALAVGAAGLAASGRPIWIPVIAAIAVPAILTARLSAHTKLTTALSVRATANYVLGFLAYAGGAVLVQGAVSGVHDPLGVAGAASIAWAAGLVVVFAPSGVGVREVVYVGLLANLLPDGELAAGAVTMRLVMIVAELAVLVAVGRPPPATEVTAAEAPEGEPSAA